MNKTIIILFIISAVAIVGAAYLMFQNSEEGVNDEIAVGHFKNELELGVVKRIGQLIHGVDAFILMNAFPKFVAEDFEGVESLEGMYTVKNGELQFVRTKEQPITSAEQTIAEESYGLLLQNVSTRLGIKIENAQSVDVVLEALE